MDGSGNDGNGSRGKCTSTGLVSARVDEFSVERGLVIFGADDTG
jgi:hypothetical protein